MRNGLDPTDICLSVGAMAQTRTALTGGHGGRTCLHHRPIPLHSKSNCAPGCLKCEVNQKLCKEARADMETYNEYLNDVADPHAIPSSGHS